MQTQIEKEKKIEQFKVGIVGPSKPKWKNPEQYEKMKNKIKEIILFYGKNLVVVSGHCSVGEERHYCVTCGSWVDRLYGVSIHVGHNLIKVYNQGGVDTEAEIIATKLGCKTEIYPAEVHQWEDEDSQTTEGWQAKPIILKGYRSRNIQIAEALNFGYCLVPFINNASCVHHSRDLEGRKEHLNHPQNGGCWTMQYAKQLGKETHLVVIK